MYFNVSKQTIEIAKYHGMRLVIIFFIETMIVIKKVVEIVIERNSSSGKYGHTEIVGDIVDDKC